MGRNLLTYLFLGISCLALGDHGPESGHPVLSPDAQAASETAAKFQDMAVTGNPSHLEQLKKQLTFPPYVEFMNQKIREAAAKIASPEARDKFSTMNLWDLFQFWTKDFPMTATELAQTLAILEVGGGSAFGERRPYLCDTTTTYAGTTGTGHFNWESRYQDLVAKYQPFPHWLRTKEIHFPGVYENEASTQRSGDDLFVQGRECMRMYRASPGHWARLQAYTALACHDMKPVTGYKCISQFVTWKRSGGESD